LLWRRNVERILVIYDDPRSQQAVLEILEPVGYSVTAAPCGAIAMQVFRSTMPELVIIDVSLPGRWVEEFCREIRARSAVVRLLVLSAVYDVKEVILLLELGADDYITKPFSPWEFLTRVRTSMRHFKPC
jgi:DNA-binding response OmpR family regulator